MPSLITALLGLAASATAVLGHGHVREVVANGLTYPGYHVWATDQDPSRVVTWSFTTEDEGPVPVARLGHPDIVCHANAQSAQASVPVAAGDEVLVRRFNSIGGFEHPGPEMHYLASCGGAPCADVADKTALEFYKFYERGLVRPGLPPGEPDHGPQLWATNEVHRGVERVDGGYVDTFAVRIPADTPTGHYVLRHEILGLHRAFLQDAEFYPQVSLPRGYRRNYLCYAGSLSRGVLAGVAALKGSRDAYIR